MHGKVPWATGLLALLVLVAAAGTGLTQSPDAPQPSAADNVLFAHHVDDGANDDEFVGFMNADPDDPTSNDVAMGDSYSCSVVEQNIGGEDFVRTWTLTLDPAAVEDIMLDTSGAVEFIAHIGAGSGSTSEPIQVSTELSQDGTVIASGDAQPYEYEAAGDDPYPSATWTTTPLVDTIVAGTDLVWTVEATGPVCAATGLFLSVSENRGRTRLSLPIPGGDEPEGPQVENVTGEFVSIELSYDEPTSVVRTFAWNSMSPDVSVELMATAENGSVTFRGTDGGGAEFFAATLDGETNQSSKEVFDAAVGDWLLEFEFEGWQGDVSLQVTPLEAPSETEDPDSTDGPGDNETQEPGDNQTDAGGDVPTPGFVVSIAVTLAGAAVAARRRP